MNKHSKVYYVTPILRNLRIILSKMVTVMAETAVTSLAPHFSSPPKKAKPKRVT